MATGLFKSDITAGLMEKQWMDRVAERTVSLGTYGTTDPASTSLVRYRIHDPSADIFITDAGLSLPGVPLSSSL